MRTHPDSRFHEDLCYEGIEIPTSQNWLRTIGRLLDRQIQIQLAWALDAISIGDVANADSVGIATDSTWILPVIEVSSKHVTWNDVTMSLCSNVCRGPLSTSFPGKNLQVLIVTRWLQRIDSK